MKIKDFQIGLDAFCENHVRPAIDKTHNRFIFDLARGAVIPNLERIANYYAQGLRLLNILDAEGNINLDFLEKLGNDTFDKDPVFELPVHRLPLLDPLVLNFRKEDFAELIRILRSNGVSAAAPTA